MSAAHRYDEWDDLVALARRYAARKYGQPVVGITLHLYHGDDHREPVPLVPPAQPATQPRPAASAWASGPEPKHLSDFQRVYWPGLGSYTFSPKQAAVVGILWEARFGSDSPDVSQDSLLREADSDCSRLLDLFRSKGKTHPAWGALILPGGSPATFRLPDPPDEMGEPGG